MGKKKEQVENISITEYEKALEPVIYTKKIYCYGTFFFNNDRCSIISKKIWTILFSFFWVPFYNHYAYIFYF